MDFYKLREIVSDGRAKLTWVGVLNDELYVRLGNARSVVRIDKSTLRDDVSGLEIIRNMESEFDVSDTGLVSKRHYTLLREASVRGIGISGSCVYGGFGKFTADPTCCTMAYDVEVDISTCGPGEFPLMDRGILSVACVCTCGLKVVITTLTQTVPRDLAHIRVIHCDTSRELTRKFLDLVTDHMPLWLVGWNNYGFDNQCMLYHYSEAADMCEVVRTGGSSMVAYGYAFNIPGCYNIDAFAYMSRARSGVYSALSLKVVAREIGCVSKTDMPDMAVNMNIRDLITYNVNDCDVTLDVWFKSGLATEIPSLAVCSSSPVYDCARYVTGTMMPLLLSSVAVSNGKVLNWSTSTRDQEYKGGYVVEPLRGHYRHVMVCDFSSMYPTIMSCCNISPETVRVEAFSRDDTPGDVTWTSDTIRVVLEDCVALFPYTKTSLVKGVLDKMVALRKAHKTSDPAYATSLKVCSNSMYGCVGYMQSALYSPACSSAVTAVGRWCLKLAYRTFERHGLKVLYGDTDSCFVTPITELCDTEAECRQIVQDALDALSDTFASTPLAKMSMEPESYHPGVILFDKKRYCKLNVDGTIKYTGVSAARRNAPGMVKETCVAVCSSILKQPTLEHVFDSISIHLETSMRHLLTSNVSVQDVASIKSRDGVKCYGYIRSDGSEARVPLWNGHVDATDVDIREILKMIKRESDRITMPCGLGDTYEVTRRSMRFLS